MQTTIKPKIGILDSGVGGLSVLREIHALLPDHPIHYICDSSHCPYGTKSPAEIQHRVLTLSQHLIQQGASIIVIACNSATIHAISSARQRFPQPFVGMEPAIKPASNSTQTGTIGVLATEASIAGEKFHHLIHTHAKPRKIKVITQPCPRFVELVEQGIINGAEVEAAIHSYTDHMLEAGADTLVLGCTHYPFLRNAIQRVVGSTVTLIDTGAAVAKRTATLLAATPNLLAAPADILIETSGDLEHLQTIFPKLSPLASNHATTIHLSKLALAACHPSH